MTTPAPTEVGKKAIRKGMELEKFKRRMIRHVARRIREKLPEKELWEDMKKEIGSNCKKLWERMRMLTLKKLKRLLEADDRVDLIGPVARMTLTDWLLFDLVIVHEKIDVIDREKLTGGYNSKVLSNLFSLVQRFEIEGRSGENLAEAWTAATLYYNSKGHQCSPMMLQRRWYQIKELTRHKFYKFWFNYRGNQRQLITAKQDSPDDLQKSIAVKYPQIITQKFLTWEEGIENRLVIMPEELSVKMRQKNIMKASDTSVPDVVLIEPQVETIVLGDNTDSEDENDLLNDVSDSQTPPQVKIKSEPVDMDEEYEVHIPPEKGSELNEEIERLQMVENNIEESALQDDVGILTEGVVIDPVPNIDNPNDSPRKIAEETDLPNASDVDEQSYVEENDGAIVINDDDEENIPQEYGSTGHGKNIQISSIASAGIKVENVDDVIEINIDSEQFNTNVEEMLPVISTVSSAGIKVEEGLNIPNEILIDEDVIMENVEQVTENNDQSEATQALPVISTITSEGVKVEIELVEDIPIEEPTNETADSVNLAINEEVVNNPTDSVTDKDDEVCELNEFDIPLNLNFADEGIDFADDGIAYVEEDEDDIITIRNQLPTDSVTPESKLKKEEEEAQESEEESIDEEDTEQIEAQKFDLKLLMYPVVYTTKLDVMPVFETSSYEKVYDKESIDKIYALSKPISKQSVTGSEQVIESENGANEVNDERVENTIEVANNSDDDLFRNEDESSSDEEGIDDSKRVKLTSYMLQKPKHRSYNPVLLCKNPDFNTRLKKLTVGFFMSARNRTLLQSCIPMTIDMTKAFEDKLINGRLYLKPTPQDTSTTINIQDDVEITSAALVKPSAVQQSLMSIDDTLENELKKCMAERVRAINLPDISQVRRLNQHLLTAEVTPLRLQNETTQDIESAHKSIPSTYVQNIKDDINNLLIQQKVNDDLNSETNKNTLMPEKQPSPPPQQSPVVISSAPTEAQEPSPMVSFPVPVEKPSAHPQSVSSAAPSRNTSNVEESRTATSTIKPRKQHRKTVYPTLAWNKRPFLNNGANQELHQMDALLTIDTLYKMLSALDPSRHQLETFPVKCIPKKKKKKNKPLMEDPQKHDEEKQSANKINQDAVIDITDDEVQMNQVQVRQRTKGTIHTKDKVYCCWCSYRIDYMRGNVNISFVKRRHKCKPGACMCCCKDLYFKGDLASVVQTIQDDPKEEEYSRTIEHVVQLVNKSEIPKPKSDCSIQTDLEDDAQFALVSVSPVNNADVAQTANAKDKLENTSNDETASLTPLYPNSKQNTLPTPKIRVYSAASFKHNPVEAQSIIKPNDTPPKIEVNNRYIDSSPTRELTRPIKILPYQKKSVLSPDITTTACTCRPNISKVNRGSIEINGQNNCTQHKKLIKGSKVILTKKLVTNENQPFYVGKGKILLTNMKMPSKQMRTFSASPVPISPTPTPQPEVQAISLPAGVQIVLLPDQTLTYIVQPNVTLTSEEYALLPQFLIAIQQQLNASGITLPVDPPMGTPQTDEVIDLDKLQNEPVNTVTNTGSAMDVVSSVPIAEVGNEPAKETIDPKANEDFEMEKDSIADEKRAKKVDDIEMKLDGLEKLKNKENTGDNAETKQSETSNAATENAVSENDIALQNEMNSSNVDEATHKKSLLSDLMEMSGIMEEDLAPAPPIVQTQQEPIILDTQHIVLHRELPREKEIVTPTKLITDISLSPEKTVNYTATNINGNFELTAVTSFAELKYSCDNNGVFFKLDLETGQLTSINVCIQKFPNKTQSKSQKSVIDLTDEPDISIVLNGSKNDGAHLEMPNEHSVVTLNEQYPPNKTRITTILQKKQRLMERLSNNLKPVNILQSKKHVARILKRNKALHHDPQFTFYSKRKRDKIEAKIDLVDSDGPIEEEYLVNSDSSDDEPLIKKVKRKLAKETAGPSTAPDPAMDIRGDTPLDEELEQEILNELHQSNSQSSSTQEQEHLNVKDQTVDENIQKQSQLEDDRVDSRERDVQENSTEEKQLNEEHLDDNLSDNQDPDEADDYLDQDEEMDDISQTSAIMSPVPTNLVLSGGALNAHNIPLNTTYGDGEESQEEDCILGV